MHDHSFVLSKWVFRWEVKRSIWNCVTLETKISINLFNFERVVNRLRAWNLFWFRYRYRFRRFRSITSHESIEPVKIVLAGGPQMSWLSQKPTKIFEKLRVGSVLVNSLKLNLEILKMSLFSQNLRKRNLLT